MQFLCADVYAFLHGNTTSVDFLKQPVDTGSLAGIGIDIL